MNSFSEILERFNRKERNLLVRDILGKPKERPHLDSSFIQRINRVLELEIPNEAWWATDYHINWLAGAIAVYFRGNPPHRPFCNLQVKSDYDDPTRSPKGRQLVEGNQEDIDLVIATCQNDLILIEAKAYGPFTERQVKSKLARLSLLHEFYKKLDPQGLNPIRFHFALQGPINPEGLKVSWPSWLCKPGMVPWIELKLAAPETILEVTRCDQKGKGSAKGESWKVFQRWLPKGV